MTGERYSFVADWCLRGFSASLALVSVVLLAREVMAVDLVDIRIALHEGFTRVVFEANAPFEHRLPDPAIARTEGAEIWLGTATASRTVSIAGDRQPTVRVDPAADGGADVWIRLEAPVALDTQVLTDPDRLVIDLRDLSPVELASEAAEAVQAETTPREFANTVRGAPSTLEVAEAVPAEPAPTDVVEVEPAVSPTSTVEERAAPPAPDWPVQAQSDRSSGAAADLQSAEPELAGEQQATPEPPPVSASSSAWSEPTLTNGLAMAAVVGLVVVVGAGMAFGWRSRRRVSSQPQAAPADPSQLAPTGPPQQSEQSEPPEEAAGAEIARDETGDSSWASDLLQMLQEVDRRLASLETKLSTVERQQNDTASRAEVDRRELELHRRALARVQRLPRLRDTRRQKE